MEGNSCRRVAKFYKEQRWCQTTGPCFDKSSLSLVCRRFYDACAAVAAAAAASGGGGAGADESCGECAYCSAGADEKQLEDTLVGIGAPVGQQHAPSVPSMRVRAPPGWPPRPGSSARDRAGREGMGGQRTRSFDELQTDRETEREGEGERFVIAGRRSVTINWPATSRKKPHSLLRSSRRVLLHRVW